MTEASALLLDTCVLIFASQDRALLPDAQTLISRSNLAGRLFVSPISAWEIALNMSRGRLKTPYPAIEFFNRFVAKSKSLLCDLTPEILVESCGLPEPPNRDPADRILIATARILDITLVSRDRAILAYGAQGHVRTLAC